MARHRWSILCRRAIVDSDSKLLSLIDVTEEVEARSDLPGDEELGIILDLQLMILWERSDPQVPEKAWSTFAIELPSGQMFAQEMTFELDLTGPVLRLRTKTVIESIPFAGFGTYWLNVGLGPEKTGRFDRVDRVPLVVRARQVVEQTPTEP